MALPIKIVNRSNSKEDGSGTLRNGDRSNENGEGKWKYPHLVARLQQHFKHSTFRSDLQRKAIEAAVQGKTRLLTTRSDVHACQLNCENVL